VTVTPMPARRGVAPLADVPDRQRRDGPPELVIRGKHPVRAVPVLSRRRDKVRQTIGGRSFASERRTPMR
jgi:hypothetical protein